MKYCICIMFNWVSNFDSIKINIPVKISIVRQSTFIHTDISMSTVHKLKSVLHVNDNKRSMWAKIL